ncbi:hypothetical protein AB0N24_26530 [Arthrobacter sp. NPDC093128]|uniref:hypothetical protein n=1 Tax=Arthrobacter sp. NPDC093128 TaxID=3154979 RepID=UPI0034291788
MKHYTMDDRFTASEDAELISSRIADHLGSAGLIPNKSENDIEVRAGSELLFRLFGFLLVPTSFPVGLTVHVAPDEDGTTVTCSAYDRLGWYVNKKLFWGEDLLNRKLTELLNEVRSAAGQSKLPVGTATFNP